MMPRSRLAAAVLAVVLTACGGPAAVETTTTTTTSTTTTAPPASAPTTIPGAPAYDHLAATFTYGFDLVGEVHALPGTGERPVVVTVHGGGWYGGSRFSLGPLADALAGRDVVAVNVSYRTGSEGGGYPATFDDVACAIRHAAVAAAPYTTTPERIVVVGHSAGAHLGAVAVMSDVFGADCDAPAAPVTGFVGLAGPYDTDLLAFALERFFGTDPEVDPAPWEAGNPFTYAAERPDVAFLLLHGDADEVVALSFAEDFAAALEAGGHAVELQVLPGIDHAQVADPLVVADLIAAFAR
ncbi:MAG: alpha/beta hydrolase [Acidimicrobiia bacterium]|jgi:acetyl esterase/lipase